MNRNDAENLINESIKPIFGFALKRCRNIQDAEDLSQEIAMRAFRTLILRDDISSPEKFIWTIAHNSLSNYYRDGAKRSEYEVIGLPPEDILGENDPFDDDETIIRLQNEIAWLSKLQREIIVGYYFDGKKQSELAEALGIPVGTVKWHLFEAKKELKRGIEMTRRSSELKFAPVKFSSTGFCGSVGNKLPTDFFGTALPQNICYSVRNEYKSLNTVAEELGVSPVYVESETERLTEYGLLLENGGKFIANFIIDEPTPELITLRDEMYEKAAGIFAIELFDELKDSGILSDHSIICGQTDEKITFTSEPVRDENFILWSLIPFITAMSGNVQEKIRFDEVATIRPDGGINIFEAEIASEPQSEKQSWNGPMWSGNEKNILWQFDSEWSDRVNENYNYTERSKRILSLFEKDEFTKEDAAWLAERGLAKFCGDPDDEFRLSWQIVLLTDPTLKKKLIALGNSVREKHADEFERLKAPYVSAVLDRLPKHLRKMREYELQFIFMADGRFICNCLKTLINNGRLKLPTEGQRKALSLLIAPEK